MANQKLSPRMWCRINGYTYERLARETLVVAQERGILGANVYTKSRNKEIPVSIFTIYSLVCDHSQREELLPLVSEAQTRLTL